MDFGGKRFGEKRWRTCAWAGLAAAVLGFAVTATVAAAQEAITAQTDHSPTLDRRAQIAASAEFEHLKALAHNGGRVRVIVGLRVAFTPEGALSAAAQEAQHRAIAIASAAVRRALSGTDHHVTRTFEVVPVIALELSEGAVTRLEDSGLAATLWEDTPRPQSTIPQGLTATVSGGATALLDTGVDKAHLRTARVISEACFSANGNCPNRTTRQLGAGAGRPCNYAPSACQHGTRVAGIAAAPAAPGIIAIQVFSRFTGKQCEYEAEDSCALAYESDHIAGLQHVFELRNTFKISSVRLSLGSGLLTLGCNDNPLKLAIDNLRSVGVATLITSGNGSVRDIAGAPACISMATTEGATAASVKPAAALPDLMVTDGDIEQAFPRLSADFALRGTDTKFSWGHTTFNNVPGGQPAAKAGRSQTAAGFALGTKFFPLSRKPVPALPPNAQQSNVGNFSEDFTLFDYGTYDARICANAGKPAIAESNPKNDCLNTGNFYVLPAHIKGTVTGTIVAAAGLTVNWKSTVDLHFNSRSGPIFVYDFGPQTSIDFTASGTLGGVCTWSGNATHAPDLPTALSVKLNAVHGYFFDNMIVGGAFIKVTLACNGQPPISKNFPLGNLRWMTSDRYRKLPTSGPWHLQGKTVVARLTSSWNLQASDE